MSGIRGVDRVNGVASLKRGRNTIQWGPRIAVAILLVGTVTMLVPTIRRSILTVTGCVLVANDPLERVDLIVVMFDTDGGGALEAADLFRSGFASRVAVFSDPPDPVVDREFLRRGLPYEDAAAREIRQLRAVGIEKVERISKPTSKADEWPILARWCDGHRVRSVLVITNLNESRRVRRELRRSMKPHHINVVVRSAAYADFHPDRWWQTHGEIRTEIEGLESLLFDIVLHPIS